VNERKQLERCLLSVTAGRSLLLAAALVFFGPLFLSEVVLGLGKGSQLGCGLADYSSHVWPSLNDEIHAVRSLVPSDECAFVLLKSFNLLLSGAIALAFMAIFLCNFRATDTLFWRMPKTFLYLFVCGVACFFLFRSYAIFNLSAMEDTSFRRHTLLRSSIMSPLIAAMMMSLGLFGTLLKDNEYVSSSRPGDRVGPPK
jgi:hypothetical protein